MSFAQFARQVRDVAEEFGAGYVSYSYSIASSLMKPDGWTVHKARWDASVGGCDGSGPVPAAAIAELRERLVAAASWKQVRGDSPAIVAADAAFGLCATHGLFGPDGCEACAGK